MVFSAHIFDVQADDTLALLQHETRLYLVSVTNISRDLFYHQVR